MNYKLVIDNDINLLTLNRKIENGARFIVFSYCIGLGAVALRRLSPAILIEDKTARSRYCNKYNRINYIFGWWAVPYGLMLTPHYIKANNKGGIDVTEDVMLNITEASLQEKRIEFLATSMLFDFPDKNDEKIFRKHFAKAMAATPEIKGLAVGWYLNGGHGKAPFYIIGVNASDHYEKYTEQLKERLYTDFFRCVPFEFMDISNNEDVIKDVFLIKCLLKQGLVMGNGTQAV